MFLKSDGDISCMALLSIIPLTLHGLLVVSTVQDSQYNISIYIFNVGLEITVLSGCRVFQNFQRIWSAQGLEN